MLSPIDEVIFLVMLAAFPYRPSRPPSRLACGSFLDGAYMERSSFPKGEREKREVNGSLR